MSLEINLQKAVFDTLTAANIGSPVYHTVPAGTPFPWVIIGNDQLLSDYEAGADFIECFVDANVFGPKPEFKTIASKVRLALDLPIQIDGHSTNEAWFEGTRFLSEKDPSIGHAVLTFRYVVQAIT